MKTANATALNLNHNWDIDVFDSYAERIKSMLEGKGCEVVYHQTDEHRRLLTVDRGGKQGYNYAWMVFDRREVRGMVMVSNAKTLTRPVSVDQLLGGSVEDLIKLLWP